MSRLWTETQIAQLVALYPDMTAANVAVKIGRSERSVHQKAGALGLSKSQAFLDSSRSGRILQGKKDPRLKATQFKSGAAPWNKGIPGSTGLHENCRKSQFKKGQMAGAAQAKYVPIGSLRVTRDGILERKVTDDPSLVPTRRWVAVHRLVWIREMGPIPEGHIVIFKPGCKTTAEGEITADRLECISRAENAKRNHPINKSPELAKLTQLKGAITRQVNRISKEAKEREMACTGKS
ncbi:HNH endonuclease signature motif containing protein [Comamonas sp. J-3]|uniref:HNH endonuclease signature motif containing protein n=1 Tax=Comamonas trifloxystrobinivorans TaxID=3350256 RepID=UPI00372A7591